MWRKTRHKKPYVRGWLWISSLPLNTFQKPVKHLQDVLQGTYRRGMVSKITGKPLVPLIDGILPSKLRGRERMAAKALK